MRARSWLMLLATAWLLTCCCCVVPSCNRRFRRGVSFSPTALPEAVQGQPYEATITVSDNDTPAGDIFVESGTLPPGLTLTFIEGTDTAEIGGSPEAAGTYAFVVGTWCFGTNVSGETGSQGYSLIVN